MKRTSQANNPETTIVPEVVDGGTYADLVGAIGRLFDRAREKISTTANTTLVETYWNTGCYIVEYEQHGLDRAKYGSALLTKLSRDLTLAYGKGFNRNNLQYMRKLYSCFPICTTLSCKLSWSHYLEILKCFLEGNCSNEKITKLAAAAGAWAGAEALDETVDGATWRCFIIGDVKEAA